MDMGLKNEDLEHSNTDKNFGNGRMARKYFENIKIKKAGDLSSKLLIDKNFFR